MVLFKLRLMNKNSHLVKITVLRWTFWLWYLGIEFEICFKVFASFTFQKLLLKRKIFIDSRNVAQQQSIYAFLSKNGYNSMPMMNLFMIKILWYLCSGILWFICFSTKFSILQKLYLGLCVSIWFQNIISGCI